MIAQHPSQVNALLQSLFQHFGPLMKGAYLYGSAVTGGLQKESDIDVLVLLAKDPNPMQRAGFLQDLMTLSAPYPRTQYALRCLEVTGFKLKDVRPPKCPARAAFHYGEWLREEFIADATLRSSEKADHLLILAQARLSGVPLIGPALPDLLAPIPNDDIRRAIALALPEVLGSFYGDESNVLLTLAHVA